MVWQGAGIVVFVIFTLALLPVSKAVTYMQLDNMWTLAIGPVLAGILCWYLGKYLHRNPTYEEKDIFTGEVTVYRNQHTALFIKVEYWGIIFIAMGVLAFLSGIVWPAINRAFA